MNLSVIFVLVLVCIDSAAVDPDRIKSIIDASQSFTKVVKEMSEFGEVAQDASKVLKAFSVIGAACGPIGAVFGSLSSIVSLFSPDPNKQLMNAITQLHKDMEKGFNDIKVMITGVNARLKELEIKIDVKKELAFLQDQEAFIQAHMDRWQEMMKSIKPQERMGPLRAACLAVRPFNVITTVMERLLKPKIGDAKLFESLLSVYYFEIKTVEAIRDRVTFLLSRALMVIPLCGGALNSSRAFIDEDMKWGLGHMKDVVTHVNSQVHEAYHRYRYNLYVCQEVVRLSSCYDGLYSGSCDIYVYISVFFKNQFHKDIKLKDSDEYNENIHSNTIVQDLCLYRGDAFNFDGTNDELYYMLWRGVQITYWLFVEERDSGDNDPILTNWPLLFNWPGNQQTAGHLQKKFYETTTTHPCEDSSTCDDVIFKPVIKVHATTIDFYNGIRWKLTTKTSPHEGAEAFDGNVHIIVIGSKGTAEKVILDNFDKEREFDRGVMSKFDFWTMDVGQLTKVKFGVEDKTDSWMLISAVLSRVDPSKTYQFNNVNKWIATDVALTPDTSSKANQWTMKLKTGGAKQRLKMGVQDSTELNADIYIVITGSNGVSEMVMPDSGSGNDFGERATDTFTFGTDDIGELKSVTFGIANGNGGWQMESAELTLEGTNDKYSFEWNKLLHVDDETVEREYTLVPDLEHQWGMQTKTGFVGEADIEQGKVWTILKGNLGESPKIYLSHPEAKSFEKGAIDLFHFGTDDLGELDSVKIGIESNDNWFVEWVSLTLKNDGKKYIFHIDQWLDSEDSEIELEPLDNLHVDSGALLSKPNDEPHILEETDEIPPVLCHSEKPGQFGEFETYYIHSGYPKPSNAYQMDVLQVPVGRIDDGSPLEHCTFVESERQKWKVIPAGNDAAYIISAKTDKVLEVPQNSEAGNHVQLSELSGLDNQKWRIEPGYYATEFEFGQDIAECDYCKIINVETGLALDMMEKDSCGSTVQTINYPPEDAEPKQTQQWYFNLIYD